jgi:alpha-amylase
MVAKGGKPNLGWWNSTVFYQVFVRSFADSTHGPLRNDGIGDIRGLIDKLDYLKHADPANPNHLSVGGLWLMPIHPSPSYHGYDVTDYFDVNPHYGTLADMRELIAECKKRNIRLIIDWVPNHCSSLHPWFKDARDPSSPKRDWFIWADKAPDYKGPWGQKVWHPIGMAEVPGGGRPAIMPSEPPFYYGLFSHTMPDFNYRNPAVSAQMLEATRFWLQDVKVDGLRLDAIRHLIEDGPVQENTPATHEWLRSFFTEYKRMNPEAVTIGEVWASSEQASSYVGDQMDLVFEFDTAEAIIKAVDTAKGGPLARQLDKNAVLYPANQFGTFLSNHDQTRVATRLRDDGLRLRLAASILFTIPGVPFVYYGEELGMLGDKPDERLRTPMQWSADAVAGFSLADAWQAPRPDFIKRNVDLQSKDAGSLLLHYRKLSAFRLKFPSLTWGSYSPVITNRDDVLAFIRRAEGIDQTLPSGKKHPATQTMLVVINLSNTRVDDYTLAATNLPFRGDMSTTEYMNNALTVPPTLDATGSFKDYRPVRSLAGGSVYLIQLESREEALESIRNP